MCVMSLDEAPCWSPFLFVILTVSVVICLFPLSVLVSVKPSDVLELNDEATLQCEVKGQHHGCEVKWRSPNTYSLTNTSTVQLKPVKTSHNGPWLCIVTCGRNTFSERLAITVQGNTQLLGMKTHVHICSQ